MADILNLGTRVVNAWLVACGGKTVLVDTGYPGGYPAFAKRCHLRGIRPEAIDYVFLTHAHDDHAGFLREMLAETQARVILSEEALPVLRAGQNRFTGGSVGRLAAVACLGMKALGKGEHRFPPPEPALAERLIPLTARTRPALEAELGVRILDTPGHTSCSVSMLTRDGLLFCGDAAMNGFPSHGRATIWAEDLTAYRQTWEAMLALAPRMLYPGHGKPFPPADLRRYLPTVAKRKLYRLS